MAQKGENTKQKIIQESMKLFSVSGFEAVSIRSIAKAVGVGNSALYKHFKSKKEILNEIVAYSIDYYRVMGNKQMIQISNLKEFQKACLAMFDFQTQDAWIVMFRRLLMIEQFKDSEMASIYRRFFIEIPVKMQAEFFKQLMKQGIMKNGNEEVLAMELYAPFYMHHLAADAQENLEELFKTHIRNFWNENFAK
ncbi:TetR/AcrR family transcriptional regulator [Eubacteriaceae bacterium ES2]|nr:TetR/AcrR family transcriptional regulator [Eubacteriaceae bacterium ES2]